MGLPKNANQNSVREYLCVKLVMQHSPPSRFAQISPIGPDEPQAREKVSIDLESLASNHDANLAMEFPGIKGETSVLPDTNSPTLFRGDTVYPVNKEPAKVIPLKDVAAVKPARRHSVHDWFNLYDKVSHNPIHSSVSQHGCENCLLIQLQTLSLDQQTNVDLLKQTDLTSIQPNDVTWS